MNPPDPQLRFFGKHRGTCVGNLDPLQRGRIQVEVPAVAAGPLGWALPCLPIGGTSAGVFEPPAIGTGVWVEFEQGDVDFPIWVGTWEPPPADEVRLATSGGASITLGAAGVVIANGHGAVVELAGPSVDLNNGALTVT